MQEIKLNVSVADKEKIENIDQFQHLWEYATNPEQYNPTEWGKVVLGETNLIFHLQPERLNEKTSKEDATV